MAEHDELSLENLAMPAGFYDSRAMAEIKELHEKYSQMTREELMATLPKYSVSMKTVNDYIYRTNLYSGLGLGVMKMRRLQFDRLKSLFGLSDDDACFKWLAAHNKGDSEIVDALVSDALGTGAWEELPDELQPLYHERKRASL